jgi:hypothetical protein
MVVESMSIVLYPLRRPAQDGRTAPVEQAVAVDACA